MGTPYYVIEYNGLVVGWTYVYFLNEEALIPHIQTDPLEQGHGVYFVGEIEKLARQKGVRIMRATDVTVTKAGVWKKMGYVLTSPIDDKQTWSKTL